MKNPGADFPTDADGLTAYLKALPKAELHVHMEGSIRPETLLHLADRNKLRLPFSHPDQCRPLYNYKSFKDFANVLLMGVHCLRHPEDFFDVVIDMGANMSAQNIRYAEITWTPQFYLNRSYALDDVLGAMNAARQQAKLQWGVEMRWIPDLVRSYPAPARLIAEWAASENVRAAGVVALGLGGPEAGHPASGFATHFRRAQALGLPANPHAGEGMGPESVRETIDQLHPSRLGHGVRSIEDNELVAYLAEKALPLEICVTSNICLGVHGSYAEHPVKRLVDAGCVVSLNSDDPVLFQTTLTDEYLHAVCDCGLDLSAIRKAVLDALRSSYLANAEKLTMLAEFEEQFELLGSAPAGHSVDH